MFLASDGVTLRIRTRFCAALCDFFGPVLRAPVMLVIERHDWEREGRTEETETLKKPIVDK